MSIKKFFFKKISLWVLLLAIFLGLIVTIFFGSSVIRSKNALRIAMIPSAIKEIFFDKYDVVIKEKRFNNKQGLNLYLSPSENEYLLLSRYDGDLELFITELIHLKEKKIIHKWVPKINKIKSYSEKKFISLKKYWISNPLLLKNGDLLIHGSETPLIKIDACSQLIWSLNYAFHHGIEKDHENNFWVPFTFYPESVDPGLDKRIGSFTKKFIDNGIMRVSEEGKVLFKKSVIQIFLDNSLEELIFPGEPSFDPIHLNDIQPVLFDGPFYKKGDVFLSLGNLSMIVLYRPSNNKILWYKKNPWVNQHDVDILNNYQISVFNNKSPIIRKKNQNFYDQSIKKNNNILIYDFKKDIVINKYENLFVKYDIRTPSQGISEIMEDGKIFVEETDFGRALEIDKDGNLVWEYINRASDGNLYPLNQFRVLQNKNDSIISKLKKINCDEN